MPRLGRFRGCVACVQSGAAARVSRAMTTLISRQLRLGFRDARDFFKSNAAVGITVALLALAVAFAAAGTASWWPVIAWLIVIVAAMLFTVIRALTGWNRDWRPTKDPIKRPQGSDPYLNFWLDFKGPLGMRMRAVRPVFACEVRHPYGDVHRAKRVDGGGQAVWSIFPADFDGARPLVPGRYLVTFFEQMPGRRRRIIHAYQVRVPQRDLSQSSSCPVIWPALSRRSLSSRATDLLATQGR